MILSQMIDGEVTRDETSAISDHMAQCAACAELYQKMLEVDLRVRTLQPPVVSSGFEAALVAKLERVSFNARRKYSTIRISAVAAGLLLLLVTFHVLNLPPEQRTPSIAIPNVDLNLKQTPCKDDASCSIQAFCADHNKCSVPSDPVSEWLTRPGLIVVDMGNAVPPRNQWPKT
jgi:hypothetical protein